LVSQIFVHMRAPKLAVDPVLFKVIESCVSGWSPSRTSVPPGSTPPTPVRTSSHSPCIRPSTPIVAATAQSPG
jgi:hypothetical protein